MGGGADYQAEAYAFVAAKILAKEALNWVETGCNRVPVSVRMETGTGGDDLLISLQQENRVELQAKKGLQRGGDLWGALMALAHAIEKDERTYGVLLTNTNASATVREDLRTGIERIGANFDKVDELPEIARAFVGRLEGRSLDPKSICKRLFIRVWNFEPGSQGEDATHRTLGTVIADANQAGAARAVLVSDGLDTMTLRGGRDATDLSGLLQSRGIALSHFAQNSLVVREAYLRWCVDCNATFVVPGLNLALPMEKAWVFLRTLDGNTDASNRISLEEQIRSYHEWYRLAESNARYDSTAIGIVARQHRLLVVVAGPGAGKSTLLRRLARDWAMERKHVLHVSLRRVSLLLGHGATFEDALIQTALDGFGHNPTSQPDIWQTASYLLTDGLDETDPFRDTIAGHLRAWALADDSRHVVVTTRPIGHNPAWFPDWKHVELLPLDERDVEAFADTVLAQHHALMGANPTLCPADFRERLTQSRSAQLASRNPLLLGFLLALYVQGGDLGTNRYRLFADILERVRVQPRPGRPYQHQVNEAEAHRAINCLGWLLMERPAILETDIKNTLGAMLATDFGLNDFQGNKKAQEALDFWEERGLLEGVGLGTQRTFTFVYMTFQEFAAARYLEQLAEAAFAEWVEQRYAFPRYREMLLMIGGTNKAETAIDVLLNAGVPDDPVSTAGLLAAEVLNEMASAPTALMQRVVDHLTQRLTSQIPNAAYETGDRLIPFAAAAPDMVGRLAFSLSQYEQHWTREVACALALLAGNRYVDEDALTIVYPEARDTRFTSGRGHGLCLNHKSILRELIVLGTAYFLRDGAPQEHIDLVKRKFSEANHSGGVHFIIEKQLRARISAEEFGAIPPHYEHQIAFWVAKGIGDAASLREHYKKLHAAPDFDKIDRIDRAADMAFLAAVIAASGRIPDGRLTCRPASSMGALATIYQVLDVGQCSIPEIQVLRERQLETELIEVLHGVLLVTALDPQQVRKEADHVLDKLRTPHCSIYSYISETAEFRSGRDLDWQRATNGDLDPALLARALAHPSYFVCSFAALLLVNCFDSVFVRRLFSENLTNGSHYVLFIISQIAKDVWGSDALPLICLRLEQNMTLDCAPLIERLPLIYDSASSGRVEAILSKALSLPDAEMVKSALGSARTLGLHNPLAGLIRERYEWWVRDASQTLGADRENRCRAAEILLNDLISARVVTDGDLLEAVHTKLHGVTQSAIEELCRRTRNNDALAISLLDDTLNATLPLETIDELSRSQPDVCKTHFARIAKFIDSDNRSKQIAGVRALGDGWARDNAVEDKLRPLLSSNDIGLRDEALMALRRLQAH